MTEPHSPAARMSGTVRDEITALVLARPLPTGAGVVETPGLSRIAPLRTG